MAKAHGGTARRRVTTPTKTHGGKHYLAPKIVGLMPSHTHYVEPYFGGGSVLLAKAPEGVSEVVNDLHKELTDFWCCLKDPELFERFRRLAEATPFSQLEFEAAVATRSYMTTTLDRGFNFFLRCRQSLAGRQKAFAPLSRTRTRGGMNEQASAWLSAVEGLPAVHARLKRVVILNRDALDVIRQEDGPGTLFYCDPPYLHETRATTGEYEHEMTRSDHDALLDLLRGVKGKFLLSGYRSDLYDAAAANCGWKRHEFRIANHASGAKAKTRKTECVWANF